MTKWNLHEASLDDTSAADLIRQALQRHPAAGVAWHALSEEGGQVYVVGGAVRDSYLGKLPKDVDLLVAGLGADEVQGALARLPGARVALEGAHFGVFHFTIQGDTVEIALPRTETSTGIGHGDFDVRADPNLPIETDLGRRDFTANSMAYDLTNNVVVDPYNGREHLDQATLSLVNDNALAEDPLRIVRALVTEARHGLQPDSYLVESMKAHADKIRHLPGERIQAELDKLITAEDPVAALEFAHESGILHYLLPEVDACFGFDQRNVHHELDVGSHLLAVLAHLTHLSDDADLRLVALLHDIGKPDSFWLDRDGRGHFYEHPDYPESANHEELGADYAGQLLRRLRFPNDRIQHITTLIKLHMFPPFKSLQGARKFLRRCGGDARTAYDLLNLREADKSGKGWHRMDHDDVDLMRALVKQALESRAPTQQRDLAIDGKDILGLGVKEGPEVGRILNELLDFVVDHPEYNSRDQLLEVANQIARNDG